MAICTLGDSTLMTPVGDEMVLLDSLSGHYYSLDSTGRQMLELASSSSDLAAVIAQLALQFDASEEQLARDFRQLMHELSEAGLVQVDLA